MTWQAKLMGLLFVVAIGGLFWIGAGAPWPGAH